MQHANVWSFAQSDTTRTSVFFIKRFFPIAHLAYYSYSFWIKKRYIAFLHVSYVLWRLVWKILSISSFTWQVHADAEERLSDCVCTIQTCTARQMKFMNCCPKGELLVHWTTNFCCFQFKIMKKACMALSFQKHYTAKTLLEALEHSGCKLELFHASLTTSLWWALSAHTLHPDSSSIWLL